MSFPDEVEVNQSFHVDVSADTLESYGIKIFMNRSSDAKSMSEILSDGEWKKQYASAPYYFSYPQDSSFSVRAFAFDSAVSLCVFIQTSPISKACAPISLSLPEQKEAQQDEEQEEDNNQDQRKDESEEDDSKVDDNDDEDDQDESGSAGEMDYPNDYDSSPSAAADPESDDMQDGPVMLNPRTKERESIYTTEAKVRIAMNYVLAFASLLLLFLLSTRRI